MSTIGFPLLLIPLAICNILIFLMPGVSFSAPMFTLTLMSGVAWTITLSDALLALGIVLLLFEVMKSARPGGKYFTDHFLALLVFAGAAAEFVMLPQFGTSMFFLLVLLMLVDVLTGIALRARRGRRAVAVDRVERSPAVVAPETVAPAREPTFDPAPVPAVADVTTPTEATATAPVIPARVEPIVAEHDAPADTSPKVVSPGLSPASPAHPSSELPPR